MPRSSNEMNYSDLLLFHGSENGFDSRTGRQYFHLRDLAISPRVQKSPLTNVIKRMLPVAVVR